MLNLDKIIKYGTVLLLFLLPWQTRWIFKDAVFNNRMFEYGRLSLYGTEILLVVLLAMLVYQSIIIHKSLIVSKTKSFFQNLSLKNIWLWIIILLIWTALTINWSADHLLGLYGWYRLLEGVGLFILILYYKKHFGYRGLNISLISAGLVQGLLAVWQFLSQEVFANKWLGLAGISPTDISTSVIEFLDQRWLRAYGALPHPNILGGFLAICFIILLFELWQFNKQIQHQEFIEKKLVYLNIYYWLSALIIIAGLVASFSRAAWLAVIAALIYFIWQGFRQKDKIKLLVLAKLSVVIILVVIVFGAVFPTQLFTTRFNTQARLEQFSIEQRQNAYVNYLSIFKGSWYKGVGFNHYLPALINIKPHLYWWQYELVHDSNLLALAEWGVVGFICLLMIYILAFKNRSNYWPLLVMVLIMGSFDHYFRSLYPGIMLWWLVLGLVYQKI